MEYVPGTSLAHFVEARGPLPVAQACAFIRQAALGLEHAHQQGMIHRDIKPQNLMVVSGGVVSGEYSGTRPPAAHDSPFTTHHSPLATHQIKILDFGLARLVSEAAAETLVPGDRVSAEGRLTHADSMMGTPDYIAPEQAHSPASADIRADIYSLGCTLYHLLAGHAPFPKGSALEKVKAHLEQAPPPLREVRPDVAPGLARVLERMLAKDPARRFQTPAEAAAALAPFCTPANQPATPKRRRRFALAAAVLCAAAVLACLTVPPVQEFALTVIRIHRPPTKACSRSKPTTRTSRSW